MPKSSGTNLGELLTIRDILMGEIIEQYNDRFEKVEQELKDQQKALQEKEKQLNQRLDRLNDLLQQNTDQLRDALQKRSETDRHNLGEMLSELGAELMGKAAKKKKQE